ncbi:DUF4349 domain-containing protein [Ruania zhangjianzhongii]|uniref:DUF4349 domain-containing protein n=1 Tax=Ruania zhangjianzhongii TaxID=2603206 RepID=UPI0011C83758|nr:DUF4349 domain-containing protein [Ruania zhangjianzhongii]
MNTTTRVLAGVALAVGLVGCSAAGTHSGGTDGSADLAHSGAESAPQDVADRDVSGPEVERQIITTARATVQVDDPAGSADSLAELVTGLGGRVDDRHTWAGEDADEAPPRASITLRVPSGDLTTVIEDLAELGDVLEVSQSSEDVTQQVVDIDARVEALRTSTDRLREIMAEASDSADLLEAETALSERQAELESYLSQREALADQVAMSTLTVDLQPTAAPAEVRASGFAGGLASGWNALLAFLSTVLVIAGTLVPWVVAIGIPVAAVLLVLRRRRRRRSVAVAEA